MTTKEYVTKYKLNISDKFNHPEFISDLANDFLVQLELSKANNNLAGFNNALRSIKMKWDAINNKTLGQLPDKLWNYFFATVVVKLRDEMCPKDMQMKRKLEEERKKQWENRRKQQKWEEEQFHNYFWDSYINSFMGSFFKRKTAPLDSFKTFDFHNDLVSSEDIQKSYRKLALIHHPDRGGKQENFIKITEDKNKCIQWLESKS